MAFLLDTHTFLWFIAGDNQLPATVRDKIKDIHQPCFLSAASLWEITIKEQIGKLTLNIPLQELFEYADRNQIEIIPINYDHLLVLSKLPSHHNDPFDRLIISQAIAENLILITRDKGLKKYKVAQQWS
ncbi:MAG: type II toxin-antitoxin system VapC family toxin [Bacteroidia bacterium]